MKKFTVSEDTEIVLDGKRFLLEAGDEIVLEAFRQKRKAKDPTEGMSDEERAEYWHNKGGFKKAKKRKGPAQMPKKKHLSSGDEIVKMEKARIAKEKEEIEKDPQVHLSRFLNRIASTNLRTQSFPSREEIENLANKYGWSENDKLKILDAIREKSDSYWGVTEDVEIVLDGKRVLLEAGDEIMLECATCGCGDPEKEHNVDVPGGEDSGWREYIESALTSARELGDEAAELTFSEMSQFYPFSKLNIGADAIMRYISNMGYGVEESASDRFLVYPQKQEKSYLTWTCGCGKVNNPDFGRCAKCLKPMGSG